MIRVADRETLAKISQMLAKNLPKTEIAKRLGISRKTLYKYLARLEESLPEAISEQPALAVQVVENHIDVVEQLSRANRLVWELVQEYRHKDQPYVILQALEKIQDQLTLQAKLIGMLSTGPKVNIMILENFSRLFYEVIQEVCCPECKQAIIAALESRRARLQPPGTAEPAD